MFHILIVDAEEDLLWALSKNLFKDRADIKIRTASTGEEALELLKKHKNDMLVTDTRVAGEVDGFNMILRAKDLRPESKLVVMTAFDAEGSTGFSPSLGVAHFINKPFDINELRDLITALIDETEVYRGVMADLALADILGLLCLCERTVLLHLNHRGRRGRIEVVDGTINHAEFVDISGPDAIWTMLGLKQGDIFMQSDFSRSEPSVPMAWQELLGPAAAAWLVEHPPAPEGGDEVDIPVEGWEEDEFDLEHPDQAKPEEGASADLEENALGFSDEELREMVMDDVELPNFNPDAASAHITRESTLPRAPMLRPLSSAGIPAPTPSAPAEPFAGRGAQPAYAAPQPQFRPPERRGLAEQSLDELLAVLSAEVPAFIAADIVHVEDGASIAGARGVHSEGFDGDAAAAFYGALVRTAVRAASAFGEAALETVQISTGAHHVLARAIPGAPYAQLVTCGRDGNLGIARVVMRRLDVALAASVPH